MYCTNTNGSYYCGCDEGYYVSYNYSCEGNDDIFHDRDMALTPTRAFLATVTQHEHMYVYQKNYKN